MELWGGPLPLSRFHWWVREKRWAHAKTSRINDEGAEGGVGDGRDVSEGKSTNRKVLHLHRVLYKVPCPASSLCALRFRASVPRAPGQND